MLQAGCVGQARDRGDHFARLEVLEQPGDEEGRGVGAERPGCVRVADYERRVGDVLQHDAVPEILIRDAARFAVNCDRRPAADLEFEARGSDDDVCV